MKRLKTHKFLLATVILATQFFILPFNTYAIKPEIVDITNKKISSFEGSSTIGLIIGEGKDRKYFKESEKIINKEAGIKRLKDKRLEANISKYCNLCRYIKVTNIPVDKGQNIAIRNVATTFIAEFFELSHLIAKSRYVTLVKNKNPYKTGSYMDLAKGCEFFKFKAKGNKAIMPSLQRDLTSLQILDAICAQGDRVPWNYCVISDNKGRAIGVQAYDNDISFGLKTDLTRDIGWLPHLIKSNGEINLPHMDKGLAEKIMRTESSDIQNVLSGLLDPDYITATQKRLKQIKEGIKKSSKNKADFLIEKNLWNKNTINDELKGNFGDSHFKAFYRRIK